MPRAPQPALDGKTVVYLRLIDRGAQVINSITRAVTAIGVAYFVVQAINALAGRETSVLVTFLTTTGSGLTAMAGIAVGGLGVHMGFGKGASTDDR